MSASHIAGSSAGYRVPRGRMLHFHPILGSNCHILAAPPVQNCTSQTYTSKPDIHINNVCINTSAIRASFMHILHVIA